MDELDIEFSSSSDDDDETSNKTEKFVHIVNEIIQSETIYRHDMYETFMGYKDIFSEKEYPNTFENFLLLPELTFISNEITRYIIKKKFSISGICFIFLKKFEHMKKIYGQYIMKYPLMVNEMEDLLNSDMKNKLRNTMENIGHLLPLESYLLKPIQRVLKYPLLIKSLLKEKNLTEKEINSINTVKATLDKLNTYINEIKRFSDGYIRLTEISKKIINLEMPLDKMKTGPVKLEDTFFMEGKKRIVIMFTSVILIFRPEDNSNLYLLLKFPMKDIQVRDSNSNDLSFGINLNSDYKHSISLTATTIEIKDLWISHIKAAILETFSTKIKNTDQFSTLLGKNAEKVANVMNANEMIENECEQKIIDSSPAVKRMNEITRKNSENINQKLKRFNTQAKWLNKQKPNKTKTIECTKNNEYATQIKKSSEDSFSIFSILKNKSKSMDSRINTNNEDKSNIDFKTFKSRLSELIRRK